MDKVVAFVTVGLLREPFGDPVVQGFVDRVPAVFEVAEGARGFISRSVTDYETYERSWGKVERPDYLAGFENPRSVAITMSLWEDLESVAAFSYHGLHGEALKLRREWFVDTGASAHVAWWTEDTNKVDPKLAKSKMEQLHANGPTAEAFSLRKTFDAVGNEYKLDVEKIRERAALLG